ncbi:MAG: T9SS type A sorting domain-containing protein [Ignavibacteriaceae bacterium]|nr:T9SS type A sorting domain-containing protein [Ignavibacteriaceae bacterium]
MPETGHIKLCIYDLLGKEIAELVNEVKQPSVYDATFSTTNATPGGVYFYRLQAGDLTEIKKMILLR